MARRATGWTCQRSSGGVKCKHHNKPGTRKCLKCGKARPPKKKPAHMIALDLPYEYYVELNGGEFCGICGKGPSPTRKLDRDHDHKTHKPRGLLCNVCNRRLPDRMTIEWLESAIAYLKRTA